MAVHAQLANPFADPNQQNQNGSVPTQMFGGNVDQGTLPAIPSMSGATGAGGGPTLRGDNLNTQAQLNELNGRQQVPTLRRRTPEPPTAFQRFVAQTTGRALPIFGQRLFDEREELDPQNGAASGDASFAPPQNVAAPGNYVIGPGDEIQLQIWGGVDGNLRLVVDRNGQITIPKVGAVAVAGVHASELESVLRRQIGQVFSNFQLSATLGRLRSIQVYVVGQAYKPGAYTVSSLSTLVNALFVSGGPAANGSMRGIELRRNGALVAKLDLYDFITKGSSAGDTHLLPGDVIVIPPAGPRVALIGELDTPAIYELKSADESLGQLLSYAGGTSALTSPDKVLIERVTDPATMQPSRSVEERRLDQAGLASTVRDGDVITLQKINPAFANAVTLRGNVAAPLRYPYKPGMKLSDLLPEPDALLTRDYFERKNVLVQFEPEGSFNRQRGNAATYGQDQQSYTQALQAYAQSQSSGNGGNAQQGRSASTYGGAPAFTPDPYNQPAGTGDGQFSRTGQLRATNGQGGQSGQNDLNAMARSSSVNQVRNLVDEPNWNYAVIERLNRTDLTTQLIPFNLGAVVHKTDPSQDLPLQPGDVVTIFGKRDMRLPLADHTRMVRIDGEVRAAGVYQLQPGDTLQTVLRRAGGLTPQAYVYGLEFTREQTRQMQMRNLRDAISRAEQQASGNLLAALANMPTTTNTQALQEQMVSQQRAELARLRTLQPNGRVSLELSMDAKGIGDLPDMPLEDGDTIYVPPRPAYVTAVGAVNNENALVWKPNRTVGDTLKVAGIQDNAADRDATFILRADGSVQSAESSGWFSSFDSTPLMPGDTVVVPEKLDRRSGMTKFIAGLKDWSQVISNFGLGVAAITVLKND